MRIRSYLLVFALAILLPMAALALVAVVAYDRQQRAAVERGGVETARALMSAVDREFARAITTLQVLTTARSLERDDLEGFHEDARRVLASQRGWGTILLIEPAGVIVVDTYYPYGTPLPPIRERGSFEEVLRTRRPAVGPITWGPIIRKFAVPVRVPVLRGDELAYVLTGVVDLTPIEEILSRQLIPADWVGTAFDSRRTVVARTRSPAEFVGKPVSPGLSGILDAAGEGWAGPALTLEGVAVYTAFSRSPTTGWGVALGLPAATVNAPLRRSLWLVGGGALALLAAAVLASLVVGRRIAGPVAGLSTAAAAFGRREAVPFPAPARGPVEVADVGRAFAEAAGALQRTEAERAALLVAAEAARTDAEAASRAKDDFLAMLGHELRNPLNVLAAATAILDRTAPPNDAGARPREIIGRQLRHLTELVDDLLDVARVTSGKIHLTRHPCDLGQVVGRTLDALAEAGRLGRHALDRRVASVWVEGDETRLEQIVTNLVGNAVKFTPARGTITVTVAAEDDEALLRVTDTGLGIPPELLPRIFDLFVQGERGPDRAQGGLGLGLTLVRRLAELHGGAVEAASDGVGHGARFTVRFPRIAAPRADVPALPAPMAAGRRRILIVEDNADARQMLRAMLELEGHEVAEAADGPTGVALALARRPDVAIIDIGLPGLDGYEVARRIRAAQEGAAVRLVALTGYGRDEDRAEALAAGFEAHLAKPVDPTLLARTLSP